ncbi:MAG: glycosyltransferase family 2 protein [Caldithrix sp.]|nr:MAG: glycosyltransferase family 2 protein [Caldithrix sp.]
MSFEISVIVPIRDEEKYIRQCLVALQAQDYPHESYEVIVVDGLSDDATPTIVKSFCSSNSNFRMLENVHRIPATGLNIGIRAAKAKVIVRVDGHAVVETDYLTQCLNYLQQTEADCVCGLIKTIQTTTKGTAIALSMSSFFGVGNARFRISGKEGYVDTGAFLAYRREIFDRIGFFDEDLIGCEDDEFHYRLRSKGGRIFFTPKIQSKYYSRSSYRELFKQYFRYGLGKVNVLKRHLRMMQLRQFVPPVLVGIFILSVLLFLFVSPVFLFIPSLYITACLFAAVAISKKNGWKYLIFLLPVFCCLHFGYGLGFISGLLKLSLKPVGGWLQHFVKKLKLFLQLETTNPE